MTATNFLETNILKLLFQALPITGIAQNASIGPVTNLYLSLHTADPTESGDQTTNEAAYVGYMRALVPRDTNGWLVINNTVQNAGVVDFPTCLGGVAICTHFGLGTSATGTGTLIFSGSLEGVLTVSPNTTPSFNAGNLVITVE